MIYVQLRARVKLAQGETLHVADAAKVLGSEKAGHCSLFCPTAPGVYTLDAIAVAKALKKVFPQEDISLIGFDGTEAMHRALPRLATIRQPIGDIARAAVSILLDQIEGKASRSSSDEAGASPAPTVEFSGTLIPGRSINA